jgi:hypothetical protein
VHRHNEGYLCKGTMQATCADTQWRQNLPWNLSLSLLNFNISRSLLRGRKNLIACLATKEHMRCMEVQLHAFVIYGLDRSKLSAS